MTGWPNHGKTLSPFEGFMRVATQALERIALNHGYAMGDRM
jgi:hypothetical protein